MLFACIIINILAIALFSLRISPQLRIVTMMLFYTAALLISVVYIQSIGSGINGYSGLFNDFLLEILTGQLLVSSLVPVKPKRLTNLDKSQFTLSDELKEILVGLLLGDLYAQKREDSVNTRLKFEQSIVHKDYIEHLYELFGDYCPSIPKIFNRKANKITGNYYSSIYFYTYSLPCFAELFNQFYPKGIKIIPNNIGTLLTPLGLAYWISDDGSWNKLKRYVVLCTDSFTLAEVEHLINVLNEKFDLKCYIYKQSNGSYRIVIPSYSIPVLQKLLKEIMPSPMLHKIGL